METPDSTPPTESEAETYLTGQVVPKASGADQAEFDAPETDDGTLQPPPGPVWRFLYEPRWLGWHLFVAAAFCGMLWLGDWQFHRAVDGNGLSWAYTFEWPLFAVFGIVFWARTIRDEFHLRRGGITEAQLVAAAEFAKSMASLPPGAMLPKGALPDDAVVRRLAQLAAAEEEEDDPELASYNAYLARLNAEVKGHNKWLRALHS